MEVYKRLVGMLLVILFCCGYSPSTDPALLRKIHTNILEHGLYEIVKEGVKYLDPNSTSGQGQAEVVARHIKTTTDVPLIKGIVFGFEWESIGFTEDEVEIIYRITHPPIKKPNGQVSTGFDEKFPVVPTNGAIRTTDYYILSEDFELVEGDWTISVIYNNEVLATKTFKVKRVEQPRPILQEKKFN